MGSSKAKASSKSTACPGRNGREARTPRLCQTFASWLPPSPPRSSVSATITPRTPPNSATRSEEHTSELQSHSDLVCRLLLEKKKKEPNTQENAHENTNTAYMDQSGTVAINVWRPQADALFDPASDAVNCLRPTTPTQREC